MIGIIVHVLFLDDLVLWRNSYSIRSLYGKLRVVIREDTLLSYKRPDTGLNRRVSIDFNGGVLHEKRSYMILVLQGTVLKSSESFLSKKTKSRCVFEEEDKEVLVLCWVRYSSKGFGGTVNVEGTPSAGPLLSPPPPRLLFSCPPPMRDVRSRLTIIVVFGHRLGTHLLQGKGRYPCFGHCLVLPLRCRLSVSWFLVSVFKRKFTGRQVLSSFDPC